MPDTTRDESPGGLGINGVLPGIGQCVIQGCSRGTRRGALMCNEHWRQVPNELRTNLRVEYRRWDEEDSTLEELREAQWACVEAIT